MAKSTANIFAFLKPVNDWLEGVPITVTNSLNNIVGSGEEIAQSQVDKACTWLSCKVNRSIERIRRGILRALHGIYESATNIGAGKAAKAISKFFSDPIGSIGDLASLLFAPVSIVFNIVTFLIKEVPRLAANLANIVNSLPPEPPSPRINYDKLRIKVLPISMSAIKADPNSLPPIESVYPSPKEPLYSAKDFDSEFFDTTIRLKSDKPKYSLSEEDRNSLEAAIRIETYSELPSTDF